MTAGFSVARQVIRMAAVAVAAWIKGIEYAFFSATSGVYRASYGPDDLASPSAAPR